MLNKLYLNSIILYDTKYFIILSKPYGLAVHGGSCVKYTLLDLLEIYFCNYYNNITKLIHRLDSDTSGCIIISKNSSFLSNILVKFKTNDIIKKYHGIVYGEIMNSFTINKPLLYKGNFDISKEALTFVKPLFNFYNKNGNYTLVEIIPKTGRMHQIRVHLASVMCPLLGDNKYGNYTINKELYNKGFRRLFLHARSVLFNYRGVDFFICAPYDFFFLKIINYLKK
jgi:23S rRNA pseudouridine955/2504/2580 synthase